MGQKATEYLFRLSTDTATNLQSRIREMLVTAVLDGHIRPGQALPSSRKLSQQLHVARNTVVLAYQQLVDEGYLTARERSGYYVADDILEGCIKPQAEKPQDPATDHRWRERLNLHPSAQRNIVKPARWSQYDYPFIYGQIDPELFPIADWRECSRNAVSVPAIYDWSGDRVDRDDPLLLEQIRTRLLPRRGVWANDDEILITLGAQHALYLIAELLLTRKSVVGFEDPGFPDARNLFNIKAGEVLPLPVDEQGLIVDQRLNSSDFIYVTPSHQYPTTVTMSLQRRQLLLDAACSGNTIVIEDDYEAETNFVGDPTPALKSLDEANRVLYIGSLSKILAPGLRMGYLVGPREFIHEARALRRLMLRHPPSNNQHIIAQFIKRGHFDSLARRLRHAYRDRWQIMGDALLKYLPASARRPGFGGTAYWVKGPRGLDTKALFAHARQQSVLLEPGSIYFADPQHPVSYFRLGYASIMADRIEPGIALLAQAIDELMNKA